MQNKVHQLTDSIHGTIYISEIEHQMMSTPYFYRLNDVYQSSTVYMTFPSNRTKRYEHSLGTMELAGQMFYAAVTNSSKSEKKLLLSELKKQFEKILNSFKERTLLKNINFYQICANNLSKLIPQNGCTMQNFLKLLGDTIDNKPLYDHALCKQEVCFFDLLDTDENIKQTIPIYSFLYQCSLQALRIAALFHDIGHPPFSHIIEFTLQKLYKDIDSSEFIASKVQIFKKSIGKYFENHSVESMILDYSEDESETPALHEQIGLDILYNAFQGVLNSLVCEWVKKRNDKSNRVNTIYLVTVIEFTFAILLEKESVFKSLHKIIDGPIDADRMDYIVRDSVNSGVDWGKIPYQRIISSIKFVYYNENLSIAFPEKVADDLDDLIVNRYKVFQRINYHHKCVKTSELMQKAVEELSKDYLSSNDGQEIIPDIKNLWCSLGSAFGQDETENQISKWTDAWLISVLSKALIRLSDSDSRSNLVEQNNKRTFENLEKIYIMLNEVLLNKKRYFPLLKRQRDAIALKNEIQKVAKTNDVTLQKLSTHEYSKLINSSGDDSSSAQESLFRINILQQHIFNTANLGLLDFIFRKGKTCNGLIEEQLNNAIKKGIIDDYFICPNAGYKKFGFDDDTQILLYRQHGEVYKYEVASTLKQKIISQRAGCLWLYVYVCMPELTYNEAENKISLVAKMVSNAIGNSLKDVFNDLFNFENVINNS